MHAHLLLIALTSLLPFFSTASPEQNQERALSVSGLSPAQLAAISSEVNAKFPVPTAGNLGSLDDIIASANHVLDGFSISNPSLKSLVPTISIPKFSDYAQSVTKATASVFTGPYVSDIVSAYSNFVSTGTSGQQFSYATPVLAPQINGPTSQQASSTTGPSSSAGRSSSQASALSQTSSSPPSTPTLTTSTSVATSNAGASTSTLIITQPGGQAGAQQTSDVNAATTAAVAASSSSGRGGGSGSGVARNRVGEEKLVMVLVMSVLVGGFGFVMAL